MSKSNVFAGDHAEDVKVLRTVCQGQFDFHAVVIGIGEDAVLRKFVQASAIKRAFIAEAQPNLSIHTLSKTPSSALPVLN